MPSGFGSGLVRHRLNSRARAATLCCILLTPRPHQRSHLTASPSSAPVGWGCSHFRFSRSASRSRCFLESSCEMYLHSPLATEFCFRAHAFALKVAPILAGRSGSRQAHRSYAVGPGWFTFPSTALLEDFPPSTCAGGIACPA